MSAMQYIHLDKIKRVKELKSPFHNISRIKSNSTIQAYINQRLQLTQNNQQNKGKELTTDTSNKSILSKGSHKHNTHNSITDGIVNKFSEGSNSIVLQSKKRIKGCHYMESLTQQLSPIKPIKNNCKITMNEHLKIENQMMKEEIVKYKIRIEQLEKIINEYIEENKPIEISKCPKPMPLVYKNHEINSLIKKPIYYHQITIKDISLNESFFVQQ